MDPPCYAGGQRGVAATNRNVGTGSPCRPTRETNPIKRGHGEKKALNTLIYGESRHASVGIGVSLGRQQYGSLTFQCGGNLHVAINAYWMADRSLNAL